MKRLRTSSDTSAGVPTFYIHRSFNDFLDVPSLATETLLYGVTTSTQARNLSGLATNQRHSGTVYLRDVPNIVLDDIGTLAPAFATSGGLTGGAFHAYSTRIGPQVTVWVNYSWTGHGGTPPSGAFTMDGLTEAADDVTDGAFSSSFQFTGMTLHATTGDQLPQVRLAAGATSLTFHTVDQVTGVQTTIDENMFPDAAGSITFTFVYLAEISI